MKPQAKRRAGNSASAPPPHCPSSTRGIHTASRLQGERTTAKLLMRVVRREVSWLLCVGVSGEKSAWLRAKARGEHQMVNSTRARSPVTASPKMGRGF